MSALLFLPWGDDFLVNLIASRLGIISLNIGGDKNVEVARKSWPVVMSQFKMGEVDAGFRHRVITLLDSKEVDAVIFPYIDLLVSGRWDTPAPYKSKLRKVVEEMRESGLVRIDETSFYAIVRKSL